MQLFLFRIMPPFGKTVLAGGHILILVLAIVANI